MVGMVVIAIYAWARGNPAKYLSPVDDDGNFCGYTDGYGDYEKLYFPDLSSTSDVRSKYVCIKGKCPDTNSGNINCKPTNQVPDCNDPSFTRYDSDEYLGIYCLPNKDHLPNSLKGGYGKVWDYLDIKAVNEYVRDMARGWPVIIIGVFITFFLCLGFVYLVEYCAKIVAWICIIGSFVFLVGLGFYFVFTRNRAGAAHNDQYGWNIFFGCCCWVGAFLVFFFVCCFCKSLRIAIAVVQASADFITDTKRILLVPIIGFVIVVIFYIIWISVAICVYTIGDIKSSGGQGKHVEWEESTRRVWYYHFFGLFWVNSMLDACASFIIIVAVCTWYFSHGSEVEGVAQVGKGFKWIWRFHCGSLALGSLILAIVQVIRYIFEQFRRRVEQTNPGNACLRVFLCMVSYCIA